MFLLFETPAGYTIFKVQDTKKFQKTDVDDIYNEFFDNANMALKNIKMIYFQPFVDTADAVSAATSCQESSSGTIHPTLQKLINKKIMKNKEYSSTAMKELIVADKTLGISLKESVSSGSGGELKIVHDNKTQELYRGIRCYMDELLSEQISPGDMHKMQLGLSHSLSRYKLKFSADKVDTMIIQAVGLLDELDKEINTYAMRVKEWYGWHFPELQSLLSDNTTYSQLVLKIGYRQLYQQYDMSTIIDDNDELIHSIKEAAEISMGTDITESDIINIRSLAEQVISMSEYRSQLYEYLRNRMVAIAPNLTILVGELVGARLISHAGSLMNLAKQPASTIQILGAEKALFRALKTKSNTPKYGLIYHASLIGQAAPKHKGKISRVLAAKAALSIRVDALSETTTGDNTMEDTTIGYEGRAKVEARLRQLETGGAYTLTSSSSSNIKAQKTAKYDPIAAKINSTVIGGNYNPSNDIQQMDIGIDTPAKKGSSKSDDIDNDKSSKKKKKKEKKEKKEEKKRKSVSSIVDDADANDNVIVEPTPQKKQKTATEEEITSGSNNKKEKKSEKKAKKDKKRKSKE